VTILIKIVTILIFFHHFTFIETRPKSAGVKPENLSVAMCRLLLPASGNLKK